MAVSPRLHPARGSRPPRLARRELVGTEIISDIEQTGPENWSAQVFVPDENVHSTGQISLEGKDEISVSGCMLGGLVCKQQVWRRVPAPGRRHR